MRASSLKYLTDNSNERDLPRNNSIHWSIFMASLIVGTLTLLVVGRKDGVRVEMTSLSVVIGLK